jgi:hypothetical protein
LDVMAAASGQMVLLRWVFCGAALLRVRARPNPAHSAGGGLLEPFFFLNPTRSTATSLVVRHLRSI